MSKQYVLTLLSIAAIFILVVGNIRYLVGILNAVNAVFRQTILIFIKICSTTGLANSNKNSISKINEDLIIDNKKLKEYVVDIHNQTLANTGRIRILMKSNRDGHFECNQNGDCIWVNQSAADLFGVERADMLGNGWASSIIETERNDVVKRWRESIQYDVPFTHQYKIYQRKLKKVITIKETSVTIRDSAGHPIMFCGSVSEV